MSAPVSLRFTETMRGFVTLDEPDPQRGYDQGRADGTALSFQLTISTDDVDAFVADPNHAAVANGHIDCDALGGRRPVTGGEFNLFVATTPQHNARGARRMLYRLPFTDAAGHALTLYGQKDIEDDPGLDLWRDTSTLYTRIYAGHTGNVSPAGHGPPTGRIAAAGVVTLHIPDFLQQLTTFRASAPGADNPLAPLRGLEAFGRLFLGELWEIYAPRVASGDEPR